MRLLQFLKWKKQANTLSPSIIVWNRFLKNKIAIFGLIIIAISIFVSALAYLISPDSSPNANQQHLELATKKPGFKVDMIKLRKNTKPSRTGFFQRLLFGNNKDYLLIPIESYHFINDKIVYSEYSGDSDSLAFIHELNIADIMFAIDPNVKIKRIGDILHFTDLNGKIQTKEISKIKSVIVDENIVSKRFILGTDRFGRDMLSRLIIGTRVSLSVGFISVIISLIIGLSLGTIAGYFRGVTDNIILWLINVVWSIPTLLLVIAITLSIGKGFWQVFIAVGLTMWVEVARVIRGQVLSIRKAEFVEAGKALGYSNFRILVKHILPNVISPVIVISAANFASAILIEAGLSFLGIGVQPPMPSWGSMIKDHYAYIIVDSAYLAILPGLAIMIMVLAFTLVGNGLRDALDTKLS